MKRVMIAGSANITGLNMIRGLQSDEALYVIGYDCTSANAANKYCKNYVVPRTTDPRYESSIKELIWHHNIDAIIASNDHDVRALAGMKLDIPVNAICPNTLNCLDKRKTSELFTQHGIITPDILKLSDCEYEELYPYVIRREHVGGTKKFTHIVKSQIDESTLSPYVWNDSIVTRFIEGDEYTIDILCDRYSNPVSVVPRLRREVRAGAVHLGELVKHDQVIEESANLARKLKLTGMTCVQCIVANDRCYFFEVNPRPGSGIDLTIHGGVNMPLLWLDLINGMTPKIPTPDWGLKLVRYQDGYFFK